MLIARDLTEAVTREKIHCTRRPTKMGHHEPDSELSASLWDDHCFACAPDGDIRVAFRPPPNSGLSFTWIVNRAFYLWEPDCVKAWSAQAPQAVDTRDADASEAEGSEPLRRKPGPRAKAEWQWFVAMKVCTLKHLARPLPTAGELAELCQDELGYHPAETAINKLLRDLHRLLG